MSAAGRILMFLVGLILLAPGACSLFAAPLGVSMLFDRLTYAPANFPLMLGLLLVWLAGAGLGALGVWFIIRSARSGGR